MSTRLEIMRGGVSGGSEPVFQGASPYDDWHRASAQPQVPAFVPPPPLAWAFPGAPPYLHVPEGPVGPTHHPPARADPTTQGGRGGRIRVL